MSSSSSAFICCPTTDDGRIKFSKWLAGEIDAVVADERINAVIRGRWFLCDVTIIIIYCGESPASRSASSVQEAAVNIHSPPATCSSFLIKDFFLSCLGGCYIKCRALLYLICLNKEVEHFFPPPRDANYFIPAPISTKQQPRQSSSSRKKPLSHLSGSHLLNTKKLTKFVVGSWARVFARERRHSGADGNQWPIMSFIISLFF